MTYPTLEEVEAADRYQICKWWRFLPSPGTGAINKNHDTFRNAMRDEGIIMNRIAERFKEVGGFTPEISKSMGWEKP